ncbi:hypothetical protein JZ751_005822, partial [Albula glossodonta]
LRHPRSRSKKLKTAEQGHGNEDEEEEEEEEEEDEEAADGRVTGTLQGPKVMKEPVRRAGRRAEPSGARTAFAEQGQPSDPLQLSGNRQTEASRKMCSVRRMERDSAARSTDPAERLHAPDHNPVPPKAAEQCSDLIDEEEEEGNVVEEPPVSPFGADQQPGSLACASSPAAVDVGVCGPLSLEVANQDHAIPTSAQSRSPLQPPSAVDDPITEAHTASPLPAMELSVRESDPSTKKGTHGDQADTTRDASDLSVADVEVGSYPETDTVTEGCDLPVVGDKVGSFPAALDSERVPAPSLDGAPQGVVIPAESAPPLLRPTAPGLDAQVTNQLVRNEMPSLTPELADENELLPPLLIQEMPSLTPAVSTETTPLGDPSAAPILHREVSLPPATSKSELNTTCTRPTEDPSSSVTLQTLRPQYDLPQTHPAAQQTESPALRASSPAAMANGFELQRSYPNPSCEASSINVALPLLAGNVAPPLSPTLRQSESFLTTPHSLLPQVVNDRDRRSEANGRSNTPAVTESVNLLTSGQFHSRPAGGVVSVCSEDGEGHCAESLSCDLKPFTAGIWDHLNSPEGPAVLIENVHPEIPVVLTEDKTMTYYTLNSPPDAMWAEEEEEESPDEIRSQGSGAESGVESVLSRAGSGAEPSIGLGVEPRGAGEGEADRHRMEMEAAEALTLCRELTTRGLGPRGPEGPWVHKGRSPQRASSSSARDCDSDSDLSVSTEGNDLSDPEAEEAELEPGEICTYPSRMAIKNGGKKTTKSWRHPLRKPTARAAPSAVKQQAASDEGECRWRVGVSEATPRPVASRYGSVIDPTRALSHSSNPDAGGPQAEPVSFFSLYLKR